MGSTGALSPCRLGTGVPPRQCIVVRSGRAGASQFFENPSSGFPIVGARFDRASSGEGAREARSFVFCKKLRCALAVRVHCGPMGHRNPAQGLAQRDHGKWSPIRNPARSERPQDLPASARRARAINPTRTVRRIRSRAGGRTRGTRPEMSCARGARVDCECNRGPRRAPTD